MMCTFCAGEGYKVIFVILAMIARPPFACIEGYYYYTIHNILLGDDSRVHINSLIIDGRHIIIHKRYAHRARSTIATVLVSMRSIKNLINRSPDVFYCAPVAQIRFHHAIFWPTTSPSYTILPAGRLPVFFRTRNMFAYVTVSLPYTNPTLFFYNFLLL